MTEKEKQSIELIRKGEKLALSMNPEGYFVGFSGGKDSQVLLELVKRAGVKYKAYYNVTTNDPQRM
jgi:phosphoadenosine phosphosulfate reductase